MKREVKIDALLAILLALAPVGYENLDLPHSRVVAFGAATVCLALLLRIGWILSSRTTVQFKKSSEFSWWRRQIIRHDITRFHRYLTSLDILVPDFTPPVTVSDVTQGTYTPAHAYRGELIVPRLAVSNRREVTRIYAAYVMQSAVPDPRYPGFDFRNTEDALRLFQATFFWTGLRDYFHASYWKSLSEAPPPALVLWNIRTAFGRKFADTLASKVLRVVVDSPQEILSPDMYLAFTNALRIADSILEADHQSWPQIQKILDDTRGQVGDFRFTIRNAREGVEYRNYTELGETRSFVDMKAGGPVPEADPKDLKAIWEIGRDIQARHPGQEVAVHKNLLEAACKPGANVQATIYRANLLRMVSILAPAEWATLTHDGQPSGCVFCAVGRGAVKWPEVGDPLHDPTFDLNEFLRLCAECSEEGHTRHRSVP